MSGWDLLCDWRSLSRQRPTGTRQFEAMLATARTSSNLNDFALVAMLGLLGLRISEACGVNIEDLGEEHGHPLAQVRGKGGKGGKVVLTPPPPHPQDPGQMSQVTGVREKWHLVPDQGSCHARRKDPCPAGGGGSPSALRWRWDTRRVASRSRRPGHPELE